MCFEVQCVKSVQTTCDNSSSSDSSFQKTVGISKCNTRIATGSSDGCLRIWKVRSLPVCVLVCCVCLFTTLIVDFARIFAIIILIVFDFCIVEITVLFLYTMKIRIYT